MMIEVVVDVMVIYGSSSSSSSNDMREAVFVNISC